MPNRTQPSTITISNRVIRFGGEVISIPNISRVRSVELEREPKMACSAIVICGVIAVAMLSYLTQYPAIGIFVVPIASVVAYGVYDRFQPNLYALCIETNDAATEAFASADRSFVEQIANEIAGVMERPDQAAQIQVNVDGRTITNNLELVGGDKVGGDKVGGDKVGGDKVGGDKGHAS